MLAAETLLSKLPIKTQGFKRQDVQSDSPTDTNQ